MAQKKVLLADDDQTLVTALSLRCKSLGLETISCSDGLEASQAIAKFRPDLLILDMNMPGGNGLFLHEHLAKDASLEPIPAILLTGQSDEETIARCNELGVHYVWKGLDTWGDLEPLVRQLLDLDESFDQKSPQQTTAPVEVEPDASPTKAPKVLVVDDDPDISKAIKIRLREYGVEVDRAFSGMQGYWTALKGQPDVVIMDFRMPEGYGNFLLGKLRSHSITRNIPVVVLTGQSIENQKDFALERELISLGAVAFLSKPMDFDELKKELSRYINLSTKAMGNRIPVI